MAKYKLEYLWLDGYTPVPNIRGKLIFPPWTSFRYGVSTKVPPSKPRDEAPTVF
jgi:hypothetical protein